MGQPFDLFDIFKISEDGSLLWVETAGTLEDARSQVNGFQTTLANDYVVLNQKTGSKIVLPYLERTKNKIRAKRAAK
jgi:hypothetical protein